VFNEVPDNTQMLCPTAIMPRHLSLKNLKPRHSILEVTPGAVDLAEKRRRAQRAEVHSLADIACQPGRSRDAALANASLPLADPLNDFHPTQLPISHPHTWFGVQKRASDDSASSSPP
jgi:hypothetical protein